MIITIRHSGDYILIGDIQKKHLGAVNGYKYLKRLNPDCKIPKGFMRINQLYKKSVYDQNGLLKPKFQALSRIQ